MPGFGDGGGGGEGDDEITWTSYTDESYLRIASNFIFNYFKNISSNYKFNDDDNTGQAPFSLGIRGPSTLRSRTSSYKITR